MSDHPPLSIFCINLDSRPDRWEHFQFVMKDTPIVDSIQRFSGIVASNGVEGCRQSHISIIRKAKEENLPWVGIMEDDCTPYDHFSSEYPRILNELWNHRQDWEVYNSGPIYLLSLFRFNDKLLRTESAACTQFIIIHHAVYDKLLDSFARVPVPIDTYYETVCANKIMTSMPPLTYQYASKSNIQSYTIGESDEFKNAYNKIMTFFPRQANKN